MPDFDERDVLLKASEFLLQPGRWTRGNFWVKLGQVRDMATRRWALDNPEKVGACAVGAITLWADLLTDGDEEAADTLSEAAQTLMRKQINETYVYKNTSVTAYNDTLAVDVEHVAAMMRNAATS